MNWRLLMDQILKNVRDINPSQLEGFIVRLEKDDEGMVDYESLLDMIKLKTK